MIKYIIGVLILIPLIVICLACKQDKVKAEVTSLTWNRTINIQKYCLVREEDWTVPEGGTLISSRRKVRSYVRVLSHYEPKVHTTYTNGKSTSTTTMEPVYREDPVYDDYYTYDIMRWVKYRESFSSGSQLTTPFWNDPHLGDDEREAGRLENYKITCLTLEDKPREFILSRNQKEWSSFIPKEKLTLIINGLGSLVKVERSE